MPSKFVREFTVITDRGERVRVEEWVALVDARSSDDPNAAPIEGLRRLQTRDGHHVNRISDTEYEILGWGPLADEVRARLVR
jgi:hypothetical protein